MNSRIKSLREKMLQEKLDGLIIMNPVNIRYLIGVQAEGTLLLNEHETVFITDARFIESVSSVITIEDEINTYDCLNVTENDYLAFFQMCNRVGFEEHFVTYVQYNNIIRRFRLKEAVETNRIVEKMRMIKSQDEIKSIEKACEITDACFIHLLEYIKIGMTERQIAFEIEKFFIEKDADGVAFDTIVASGENSSKPHAVPSNRIIQNGDTITIDFGAKYNGYCADMTRTFFIGNVSEEQKELYEFVLNSQIRAFNKIKNGADGKIISKGVQDEFYAHNYGLIHALGHGVGLEVHEIPYLSYKTGYTLKENMIVTNEPGIYIPSKFGIRIEDTVLVNNMSATNLTKSDKRIIVI